MDRTAAVVTMDALAPTRPAAAELERPTPTARRLEDATLASYLAELHDQGPGAPPSASTTVAAACFRARLASEPSPAGERAARILAGYRRADRRRSRRGQVRPFGAADLAAVLATCHQPRRRGRGRESDEVTAERGRLDAVIAGFLFMAGMRRSEVSALSLGRRRRCDRWRRGGSSPSAAARRTRRARRRTCGS